MRLFEVYNIPRNKMPQINKSHLDNYEQKLMVVDINKVTPSQSDRVPGLVDKTLNAFKAGEKELLDKPMVVDRDMNIVNGHHRYDALKQMGMTKVPVLKVDATLPELIKDFSHTTSNRPVKEVKYTEPQLDVEWEEANRYPYLAKLGQAGWVELAKQGKAITIDSDSVKKIGNTGADGSETLDDLEPDKVDRLNKSMKSGTVEMPIVVKQPDGSLELIAGNTRLIGLINKQGKAVVWYVDASNLEESFNQPYPVKLNKSEDGDYDALVKLSDGTNMEILFTNYGGIWDMEFHRGGSQGVTGEGDAYRIFATMLSAVKQFIQTEKPRIVSFQATKDVDPNDANPESRAKLYNRMVDKFANALGYNASVDDYGDTVEYELVAKQGMGEGNKAQKGIPANATDAQLRSARKAGGDKGKRAHWLLNMRKGNRKRKKS